MNEQEAKNREMYFQAKKRHSIGRYLISDAEIVSEQEKEINRYRNKIQAMEKTIRELNMANLDLNIKLATKDGKLVCKEERGMKSVYISIDEHLSNIIEYLKDKYCTSTENIITEAITEYYAEEIEELVRKEE